MRTWRCSRKSSSSEREEFRTAQRAKARMQKTRFSCGACSAGRDRAWEKLRRRVYREGAGEPISGAFRDAGATGAVESLAQAAGTLRSATLRRLAVKGGPAQPREPAGDVADRAPI